jgi:hypothetical protein
MKQTVKLILYRRSIISLFTIACFILLCSCSQTSESSENFVNFSGNVTLENRSDHSGVTMSLYKPVDLDSSLLRINQEYPSLGVQISQYTEFDHREHKSIYATISKADGSWKINNVKPGIYNVVAEKDSFCWKYLHGVESEFTEFNLSPVTYLSTTISNDFIFEADKQYVITKSLIIQDINSINFEANSMILLEEDSEIIFKNSGISFPDNGFVVFNSIGTSEFRGIQFDNISGLIQGVLVKNSNKGLKFIDCNNILINRIYFSNNERSLFLENCSNCEIKNLLFVDSYEALLILSGDINSTDNIFIRNHIGVECLKGNLELENSYFKENFIGATLLSEQNSVIQFCEFDKNINSDITIINNDPLILFNKFFNESLNSIFINGEYIQDFTSYSDPKINYNNFICKKLAMSLNGNSEYFGTAFSNRKDIDARYNYWNTVNNLEIEQLIFDKNEVDYLGKADYSDYQITIIDEAGINKE